MPWAPVAFAPGRATPLVSVWRLHIDTGLPVSAVSPAMPLPSGIRRAAWRTGSGTPYGPRHQIEMLIGRVQPVDRAHVGAEVPDDGRARSLEAPGAGVLGEGSANRVDER